MVSGDLAVGDKVRCVLNGEVVGKVHLVCATDEPRVVFVVRSDSKLVAYLDWQLESVDKES